MIYDINDARVRDFISLVKEINGGAERFAYVATFGCQQNERDSETISGLLAEMGYQPTDNADIADIIAKLAGHEGVAFHYFFHSNMPSFAAFRRSLNSFC